ncbi:type V secrestion protein A [Yersinia entomophaga]|uniref:Type V secrestion protein A n=1 Tax=Yersinia entomophaga TaxID=935293 RepID=A0ABN4PR03_YERET|nr:autotransporter outer membrane beta-barrel domain-containing protein [Yersinia entomophaga]ANI29374.1 type V secrestion protein A [Yersinia entomophaga]OWF88303.1 autotransporter domain-containing protein [Yersinia entomophaga]
MDKKHIKNQIFSCNETTAIIHSPLAKISAFIILTCGVSGSTSVLAEYAELVSGDQVVRTGDVIDSGDRQAVENGGKSQDATINQRGVQIVRKHGTTYGTTINKDGVQSLYGNGIADFTTINPGGEQEIGFRGLAKKTKINGGTQTIHDAGFSAYAVIEQDGTQSIQNEGLAYGTTIESGNQHVAKGGTAAHSTVKGRGRLNVSAGGRLTGKTLILEQGTLNFTAESSEDVLRNDGQLIFQRDDYTLDFGLGGSGSSAVVQNSPGNTLTLTQPSHYFSETIIKQGTVKAAEKHVLSPNSQFAIHSNATLDLGGFDQKLIALNNNGTVNFGHSDKRGTTLIVTGDYSSHFGLLHMNATLAGDSSLGDKLIVEGNTSGHTYVQVNNLGGSGAKTLNGIELITVAGMSDGVFVKNSRIVAGSYEYDLHRGSGDNQSNWYLSSNMTDDHTIGVDDVEAEESSLDTPLAPIPTLTDDDELIDDNELTDEEPETSSPDTPHVVDPEISVSEINDNDIDALPITDPEINNPNTTPVSEIPSIPAGSDADPDVDTNVMTLRPEAAAYGANLSAANNLFITSLNDRLGETHYTDVHTGERRATSMWLRNEGGHQRTRESQGQLSSLTNRYVVQLGGDIAQWSDNAWGHFRLGIMAGYGNSKSKTESRVSGYNARSSIDGYSTGLYSTWYANSEEKSGLYLDSWVQYSWFNNSISGQELATERYKSKGLTASVESGYTFKLAGNMARNAAYFIQPKAQMIWMGVKADEHKEENGSYISGVGQGNIQTRLGVKAFMNGYSDLDKGNNRIFQPFIEATWLHNTKSFGTTLDSMTVQQSGTANIGELKLGVEGHISEKLGLWGNVGQQIGGQGYSDTAVILGVKYQF